MSCSENRWKNQTGDEWYRVHVKEIVLNDIDGTNNANARPASVSGKRRLPTASATPRSLSNIWAARNDFRSAHSSGQWIPIEKVHANDYNPNSVATQEMKLLYRSVKADGNTQPVVTIYDEKKDRYVIVDGFHRYSIMRRFKDIYASCEGKLPCVRASRQDHE